MLKIQEQENLRLQQESRQLELQIHQIDKITK